MDHPTDRAVSQRAFSVAGPAHWNQLPSEMRETNATFAFKQTLKTSLSDISD